MFSILFLSSTLSAQEVKKDSISIGERITINSKLLNESRTLLISTPDNFDKSKPYHVIYLFDAEYLFTSTVGIVTSLINARKIPPSIIVGIESTNRARDFIPPIEGEPQNNHQSWIKKKFPQFGGTENFTAFLQSELFPFVEKNYPVKPNRTMIGYSNSGVFGLHTLVSSPSTFTNYLLISPAAWWGENEIDEKLTYFSESHESYSGNLFLTVAGEGRGMYSNSLRIAAQLEAKAPQSLHWVFKQFENETHQSTIYPSIYQGLTNLFEDINFKISDELGKYASVSDIENYYAQLSKRYEYDITIPEIVFSDLADAQFLHHKNSLAIDTLKQWVSTYPASSFAYTSLARGYMFTEKFTLAKLNFENAIKIVTKKEIKDPSVMDYLKDSVEEAQNKINHE
ncbi:alpha/beta hydrolase [Aliikangiella coralliicola]|uniref:alpha/beta hydrolase n=1 Tax=Aliikangiella coralliicola TaxID=2592383 RepID=UPI00143D83E3|nr:alpha/beta hydrolase-fold protein [Aliikangiella coralliicola]